MNNKLETIEIKNFKCFKDFKADGLKRVNLIGGKNNVGKTAFMEACYFGLNVKNNLYNALLVIELNRNPFIEFTILKDSNNFEFKYDDSIIKLNNEICSKTRKLMSSNLYTKPDKNYNNGINEIMQFYRGDNTPLDIKNNTFISVSGIRDNYLSDCVDDIKLSKKWDKVNSQLYDIFGINKIDVIKNRVMLEYENEYLNMFEFGDGIKHFINIILSINLNENSVIFLDEVDNGIHHTNFDKLWEIILKTSKEQNVQVFATTHSQECIESYARVAKKLEDEDISFIELVKNKNNELKAMTFPYDWFIDEIEQNHEVRGW